MSDRIHDDEPDTGEAVVRALLAAQCPQWAGMPIEYLRTSGTDNAMWRVSVGDGRGDGSDDLVVRLPRRPGAAAGIEREIRLLEYLAHLDGLHAPTVRHLGTPTDAFPHTWAILDWIPGTDLWAFRERVDRDAAGQTRIASDLAAVIDRLATVDTSPSVMPDELPARPAGSRGGPLGPLLDRLEGWLDDTQWNATDLIDVGAVRRQIAAARELVDDPTPVTLVHGDLIPGNLLVDDALRLSAVIDWGGAALADPAQDLAPAWAVFDRRARTTFRDALGVDDAMWARGKAIELEHAVGGVLYYVPRGHPLGDVMSRTLGRILDDES